MATFIIEDADPLFTYYYKLIDINGDAFNFDTLTYETFVLDADHISYLTGTGTTRTGTLPTLDDGVFSAIVYKQLGVSFDEFDPDEYSYNIANLSLFGQIQFNVNCTFTGATDICGFVLGGAKLTFNTTQIQFLTDSPSSYPDGSLIFVQTNTQMVLDEQLLRIGTAPVSNKWWLT